MIWLFLIFNFIKYLELPRDEGALPCKLLNPRGTWLSNVKFPKESGMIPFKLLSDKSGACKLLSSPVVSGIVPVNWLYSKPKAFMLRRFYFRRYGARYLVASHGNYGYCCWEFECRRRRHPSKSICKRRVFSLLQFLRSVIKSRSLVVPIPKFFLPKFSLARFMRLLKSIPNFPVKRFSERLRISRFDAMENECRIESVRLFQPTTRFFSFGRLKLKGRDVENWTKCTREIIFS